MNASNPSFGFGQQVTGGAAATEVKPVQIVDGLVKRLTNFADSQGPTVIELGAGTYDFKNQAVQTFTIRGRNLTIRAQEGARVFIRNLNLILDLERADNILIQDLNFVSDGTGPRDAIDIKLGPPVPLPNPSRKGIRITHCSFNGYFDLAIDTGSQAGRPPLLATIDHCLFFDSKPGQPEQPLIPNDLHQEKFLHFVNRGAINIDSSGGATAGNSSVTVAFNVFVNVWRRSPRVAETSNRAHVFNNLLFRWGFGNDQNEEQNGTKTWVGVNVGRNAEAVIQANRFIPWEDKLDKVIEIDNSAFADDGSFDELSNRFDTADGTEQPPPPDGPLGPKPPDRVKKIDLGPLYQGVGGAPNVTKVDQVNWMAVVTDAGPRSGDIPDVATAKQRVKNVLATASR